MSYQVIARRWRPKQFADVVGQEHITRTLKNALKQGRLAHAFLFSGPRGVGKTSTARILARAVNCPNLDILGEAEPCNECETCRALIEDRELDVIEMDAASYTSVDDIRRINESCRLSPVAGRKKIYIIDEVHMLSRSAFNAFLKTLEEPPDHVIFILATTDVHKVPATILSRVQRFDFRPVQPALVAPHLAHICETEGWQFETEALWLIARRAEGSLRDAEGLLDQVVSFGGNEVTLRIARDVLGVLPGELLLTATVLIARQDLTGVPAYLDLLAQRGVDYVELLRALQNFWIDLAFLKEGLPVSGRSDEEIREMTQAAQGLETQDLFRIIRLAENLEDDLKWSTSPKVRFDVAFLRWVTLDRATSIREILDSLRSGGRLVAGTSNVQSGIQQSTETPAKTGKGVAGPDSNQLSSPSARKTVSVAQPPSPGSTGEKSGGSSDDLFASLMNRFGGVLIDPAKSGDSQ